MPTLIAHTAKAGANADHTTSDAVDTSGATSISVSAAYYNGGAPSPLDITISDNKGNTYPTVGSDVSEGGGMSLRSALIDNPIVGSGHTFTVTNSLGTAIFAPIAVEAWSGTANPSIDQTNANGSNMPGSITPTQNGEVLITTCAGDGGTPSSVDSGFSIDDIVTATGSTFGIARASHVQSTASAVDCTWSGIGSNACSRILSLLAASAPAFNPAWALHANHLVAGGGAA